MATAIDDKQGRRRMTNTGGPLGLFPSDEEPAPNTGSSNIIEARGTGVLPYQRLLTMVRTRVINSKVDIELDQIQPASLDLRLGRYAYRVRASFLPGLNSIVMERIKDLDGFPPIDLEGGAVFERGAVYVVELSEAVSLNSDTLGVANPKSSTGRLDVLTRLITDRATAFDRIEKGYEGSLFLEVAPLTFSIVVRSGVRLNQVRFQRDRGVIGGMLSQADTDTFYSQGQLIRSPTPLLPLREGVFVPVTVDLKGSGPGAIVGYKAKRNSNRIDVGLINHYDPREFWYKIESTDGSLNLDEGDFYLLATREDVGVPPQTAAEMVPYDTRSGEFRAHYAGFFDPGFGWADGKAGGSKAVLEVRSNGVSFTLEHGQIIGWLRYAQIATGYTEKLYGRNDFKSSYQGQGVALAKHFKEWPT
jgi:dCTP deaminase